MLRLFFLVTISNALELDTGVDLVSLQTDTKSITFETYEGSKHPVKPVALEAALQNVQKLPEEIRAMLTTANATLPQVSAHDRARALRAAKEAEMKKNAFLTAHTTHGSHLVVDAGSGMDPNADDPTLPQYATLDKVRATLNDLYQQTMEEMDVERAGCYEAEFSLKTQIGTNTDIRVTLAATIAQARGEIATAQANIMEANTNLISLNSELTKHNEECKATLDLAYEKKAIIESDLGVAQTVQNMTDCAKMEANAATMTTFMLFQCMVHSNGRSHVHLTGPGGELLKKFRSKEAFMAMMTAARASLGAQDDPAEKDPELPAGNFSQDEFDEWLKLPQDGAWMDNVGVAELPKDCKALDGKINLGEKCAILFDAVGQMVGEITDALFDTNQFIKHTEDHCQEVRENLEAQISEWTSVLSSNQISLSEATEKLNTNEEALRKRVQEFLELRDELIQRMTECNENLRQLFEEMCGLITIRNELYKMSGVHPYIQDCAVGDWAAQECSVTCGGGVQTFTRDITQEQYFGAACAPLQKEGMCNTDRCPTDCVYEKDWSQWSACSSDCGGGVQQRSRSIKVWDSDGGLQCEATQEDVTCNQGACDVDCVLGEWTEWAGCSKMCDSGVQTRRKLVVTEALGTGQCSGPDEVHETAEGGGARFTTRECNTKHCLENLSCNTKIDVTVVLDGSGSVGSQGWAATVRFAKGLVDRMYLSYDDGATVGIVLFSRNVEIVHAMSGDRETLDASINSMHFPRSYTQTGEAIRVAMNVMATGGREGVPGIVFVVTDGRPTFRTDVDDAAAEAKRAGTRLFFVGVGRNMDFDSMAVWAAAPSEQNIAYMDDYEMLSKHVAGLLADLCPILECSERTSDADEYDYIGCQSETVNEVTCQKWTDQTPQYHHFSPSVTDYWKNPYYPTVGDFNFCRNPDHDSGGIWCYTQDSQVRWDYCDTRNTTTVPDSLSVL